MRAGAHRAVPAAVVVAVLAAGCGGSSAPSRAAYGHDVDRICATLEDRVDAIQRDKPSTPDELIAYADKLARALDDGVKQLQAVERPDGDDGVKAQRWLAALRRQADEADAALSELEDAARKRDGPAAERAIRRIQGLDASRVNKLASDAGARGCAS